MISRIAGSFALLAGLVTASPICRDAAPAQTGVVLRLSARASGQAGPTTMFAGLESIGRAERFGLSGRYHEVDDFKHGRFAWKAEYGSWPLAEGLDRHERWRMDASRRVHALNSDEARAAAVTEAFIASRGYVRTVNDAAIWLGSSYEQKQRCDRIALTPPGGRMAILWIGRQDRLVRRIDLQLSERVETIRYGNYRAVRGAVLPFSIAVDDGDEPATSRITISSYRFLAHVDAAAVEPPPENLGDARIEHGLRALTPLSVDPETQFPIIFAAIDGRPAMPFIVDTGGHDILTPGAARQLNVKIVGSGESFGAGSGSTSTAFTSLTKVRIGNAVMLAQPFTVLDIDLGKASNASGQRVAIAGILGLELLERFGVVLNFIRNEASLTLQPSVPKSGDTVVPLTFTSDVPLVNARLAGRSGSFSVDTGNNVGLIVYHRWLASRLSQGVHVLSGGMGGSSVGGSVMFRRAQADSFVLGAIRIDRVPVFIADARAGSMSSKSEAGNIGVPVLSRFSVSFDYRDGTMAIHR